MTSKNATDEPSRGYSEPFDFPARSTRRDLCPAGLALIVGFVWTVLYNQRFWMEAFETLRPISAGDGFFIASLFGIVWALHALALLLCPGVRALRIAAAALFIAASVGAYFADTYGTAMDREAIRNVLETDTREAIALFNARFLWYLCVLGVAPAVLVVAVRIKAGALQRELAERGAVALLAAALAAGTIGAMGAHSASFLREHKAVRLLVTPANIVYGFASHMRGRSLSATEGVIADLEDPVRRVAVASQKPLVLILVVGETARAANFQLGGYPRATNPELASRHVWYFRNVSSCGTSTAISLPCMFSGLGRKAFGPARAQNSTNLLDSAVGAGFLVEWRDNNSGCKGICARVATTDYTRQRAALLCGEKGCYDEIMLAGLQQHLRRAARDTLIVLHQAGSHGPAYVDRYPPAFRRFEPVCRSNELSRCRQEEVVNAYDNSIAYTDHTLARLIDMLRTEEREVDSALMYVSDHGESLGEKGLYLHGAPYLLAPSEQTHVPLVLWLSDGYRRRFTIAARCIDAKQSQSYSHDNLYHTVLGLLGIASARYDPAMDMLADCRAFARQVAQGKVPA